MNYINDAYENFHKSIMKEFMKSKGFTEYEILVVIEGAEKEWSNARWQALKDRAILLCNNSMYFPWWKRLLICKYILFGDFSI